ncbi:hypothetical protein C8R47DRAFT_1215930 [Mycena vitilis]|nr:hypothetical protein C8R47DRAFT_1215930 [Mycena vitilis]
MDSFTATTAKVEGIVLPPVNEDDGTGSSGSCVVCKEDTSLPAVNEDDGTGSSDQHTHTSFVSGVGWREGAASDSI